MVDTEPPDRFPMSGGAPASGFVRPTVRGTGMGADEASGLLGGSISSSRSNMEKSTQDEQSVTGNSDSSKLAWRRWKNSGLEFSLSWAVNVLGLTAAILFGIWAPLSYHETASSNNKNNEAQSMANAQAASALSIQSSMADVQSSMAHVQSSLAAMQISMADVQSLVLDRIQDQAVAVGQLLLIEFCATQTTFSPCKSYLSGIESTSLVNYLASPSPAPLPSASTTRTPRPTTSTDIFTTPTASSSGRPSQTGRSLSTGAIVGIMCAVIAVVLICGAVLGSFVWRQRVRRSLRWEQS